MDQLTTMADEPEKEDLGAASPPQPIETKFPINIRKAEFSIFELHRRWRNGTLRLDPEFQREFVWPEDKQTKLVESVMASIPLPVLYLSDESDRLLVVDGQQRLTTLFAFMEGRFADPKSTPVVRRKEEDPGRGRPFELRELRLMKELEGKSFDAFDPKLRRKFEDTQLVCFALNADTSPDAKFELFERINVGAMPLVPQEIRNALFRGPGLELVRDLAGPGSRFRQVAGAHRVYKRMRADELVLRGVAFSWRGWGSYSGDLKEFLNDSLRKLNDSSADERASVERRFLQAVSFAELVFGDKAWQRYDPGNGQWSGHLSGPLVEVVAAGSSRVFADGLPTMDRARSIREAFMSLCAEQTFQNAILTATQTVSNVRTRMEAFERICRDVK